METPPAAPARGGKRAAKATVERVDMQSQAIEQTLKLTAELAAQGITGVQEAYLEQLRDCGEPPVAQDAPPAAGGGDARPPD